MQGRVGTAISYLVGTVIAVIFGTLGIDAWRDWRAFDETPTRSTLLAAVEASTSGRRWVSVEGAAWRCEDLRGQVSDGMAFLPARADDGSTVVARFDHEIQCGAVAARPLTGVIEPMAPKRAAELRAAGLALSSDARLRTLDVCTSCGKANARLGVLMCTFFVLLGLSVPRLSRAYVSWREREHASHWAAIHAPPARAAEADRAVRLRGAAALLAGAAAMAVGEGWVAWGIVPVQWIGVVALLLGGWMLAFPGHYRERMARAKRR